MILARANAMERIPMPNIAGDIVWPCRGQSDAHYIVARAHARDEANELRNELKTVIDSKQNLDNYLTNTILCTSTSVAAVNRYTYTSLAAARPASSRTSHVNREMFQHLNA